jgi:hypothetical protein
MKNKLRIISFYIGVNILGIPLVNTHIIQDNKSKHYQSHVHSIYNTYNISTL